MPKPNRLIQLCKRLNVDYDHRLAQAPMLCSLSEFNQFCNGIGYKIFIAINNSTPKIYRFPFFIDENPGFQIQAEPVVFSEYIACPSFDNVLKNIISDARLCDIIRAADECCVLINLLRNDAREH